MPNTTPNLGLIKPLVTENYDIAKVTNENADILDLEIKTVKDDVLDKQDTLVSGTSIKTINSNSLLGSGNLVLSESGSNANGQWVKFEDGTMIQYGSGLTSASISASVEADITLTFPIPFVTVGVGLVSAWANVSWNGVFIKGQSSSLTNCQVRIANGTSAQTFSCEFLAVGKWK